jgi:hypothetical protein
MDKSGANLAALQAINAERETPIKIRQVKYLNNIVEQDHRAIKRRTRPMMGFKDFRCARIILSGIETMHMIRKAQMKDDGVSRTAAEQFYSLIIQESLSYKVFHLSHLIATLPDGSISGFFLTTGLPVCDKFAGGPLRHGATREFFSHHRDG